MRSLSSSSDVAPTSLEKMRSKVAYMAYRQPSLEGLLTRSRFTVEMSKDTGPAEKRSTLPSSRSRSAAHVLMYNRVPFTTWGIAFDK